MNCEVSLEGMKFHAGHGYYPFERVQKNHFVVDLKIRYEQAFSDLASEDLTETVDYEQVYQLINQIMSDSVKLLETLAHRIISGVIACYPDKALQVEIKICKLQPPLKGRVEKSCVKYVYETNK